MAEPTPAELVRELRGSLSHDKFAAALGTSRQTVIRWEKGTIPRGYAKALAEYSGGKYKPEDFDLGLTGGRGQARFAERLEILERRQAELEQRIAMLEKRPRA